MAGPGARKSSLRFHSQCALEAAATFCHFLRSSKWASDTVDAGTERLVS